MPVAGFGFTRLSIRSDPLAAAAKLEEKKTLQSVMGTALTDASGQ